MTPRFVAKALLTTAWITAMVIGLTPHVPAQTQRPAKPTAQTSAKPAVKPGWAVPRTPDGKPDLQGLWTNATVVPLERTPGHGEFLTKEQAAELLRRGNRDEQNENDVERSDKATATAEPDAKADAKAGATAPNARGGRGGIGDYNATWWQLGKPVLDNNRSSIIVGPEGRLPHTPETAKLLEQNREYARQHPADGPEFRDNIERCLTWITSGPPMLPTFYNNTYQIFQTPDNVAILVEMIHDVRMIPIGNHPQLNSNVRQWVGSSRGHWEGDTLVVDTTNMNSKRNFIGGGGGRSGLAPNNDQMHVVERFTRTGPDTLLYQFTVENPAIYTHPWSGEIPMKATKEPLYEYACGEGNYALMDILAGARAEEKAAAAAGQKKQ
ncbi:MAG TPA: hypothetical protein VFA43_01890 [Gemmatimonadaceae bacterium]|nr:hypothetical protein [Gemmatimonadaceae bacterium]